MFNNFAISFLYEEPKKVGLIIFCLGSFILIICLMFFIKIESTFKSQATIKCEESYCLLITDLEINKASKITFENSLLLFNGQVAKLEIKNVSNLKYNELINVNYQTYEFKIKKDRYQENLIYTYIIKYNKETIFKKLIKNIL